MKTILSALTALFLVTAAFAGDTAVKFSSPTTVNGTKVAAGEYILRYEIKGNTADVKIMQSQKVIASTTATVVENKDKSRYTGVVREQKADGTSALREIQFADQKQVIRFDDGGAAVGK
jgi:hypothetical protein